MSHQWRKIILHNTLTSSVWIWISVAELRSRMGLSSHFFLGLMIFSFIKALLLPSSLQLPLMELPSASKDISFSEHFCSFTGNEAACTGLKSHFFNRFFPPPMIAKVPSGFGSPFFLLTAFFYQWLHLSDVVIWFYFHVFFLLSYSIAWHVHFYNDS